MASKFPAQIDGKVELRPRKGHDMTWSCYIHGEPIKFYCKKHKSPICHPCATKDHGQKPCKLDDIGDVILERRRKLDDKRHEIERKKKQLKTLDSKIQSISTFSSNHFVSVNDEVKVTSETKLKSVKDKEGNKIRSINEEADMEIRIINKLREKRIKSCNEEAEQQQLFIKESYEKILSETKEICELVSRKIKDLTSKNQHAISTMDNIDAKIRRIKQDDKTTVTEAPQVLASFDDNLNLNVHQDVSDCLDRIERDVQRVKFVEGEVGGEHYGRIDGYIGKWELVKSIHIPSIVNTSAFGFISDDEIGVRDVGKMVTYVTNINTELNTQKVIEGGSNMYITSCAPIDSNVIVCGKWGRDSTGGSLDGCITLYDRQWKVIRDINIPRNGGYSTNVFVDVDRDGMILAAQHGQSNIYVINPADAASFIYTLHAMASRFPPENQVQMRPRKGHDMKWSCDKHAEPIAFYCKEHILPVCDRCAIKEHCQKPCELDDIEDVILETRRKLDDKQHEIEKKKKQLKTLDNKIDPIATFSSNHFQTVNDEVKSTYNDKSKSVNDDEEKKIRLINEEADKEIRIINEKRDKRIKACNAEKEKQQLIIKESEAKFISETKAISEVVSKQIKYLTSKNQHAISTLNNIDAKINRIKQDDKTLVNEAPQVLASLDENLSSNFHQDVSDCVDQIQLEVQRVKFVEGKVGGEHYGRIDGYIGKWELVKSIHIPPIVNYPRVWGLISDDEVCVRELANTNTYVTNINTEHTQKVIKGGSSMHITSCAPIDSNVIVCGKGGRGCTGDSLDGCITLYDIQWRVIRDISIPRNNSNVYTIVHVDVDGDGMIIAAQNKQPNIYVINHADGKIVNTITKQGKEVCGQIQVLPSGDIVVQTGRDEYTVISRSGEEKAVIHCVQWCESRCRVDKLTYTLYITYLDTEHNIFSVDQVSCDGIIQARKIVENEKSDLYINPCLVTPSGNLVTCNGDKLFVYKKIFIV